MYKYLLPLFLAPSPLAGQTEPHEVEVAVISLNDFHASFVRNDAKGVPGAAAVLQTADSLKRVYPNHVTVSAGDNFGGSYFYRATSGVLLPAFFDALGIRVSALGNHEFDDGHRVLANKWKHSPLCPAGWDITYVAANVRQKSDGNIPSFASPCALVDVPLANGRKVKVGLAGLLTGMTPQQASARRIASFTFDGRYGLVLDSLARTKTGKDLAKADLRILLTHIGTALDSEGRAYWHDSFAGSLNETGKPEWHAALSSHTHEAVLGTVGKALPVVQGECNGRYLSLVVARIDTARHQVTSVRTELVPVHPKARLEARPARMQALVDSLLQNTRTPAGTPIGEHLTTATTDLPHDRHNKMRRSPIGTLVCQSFAEAYRRFARISDKEVVIGVSHIGSIRAGISRGPVSVLDVGEALPFANRLRVYKMDGKEVLDLLSFGLQNRRFGQIQTSPLTFRHNSDGTLDKVTYTTPRGKQGTIAPGKYYYIVADEYMTTGGDGYSPALFPESAEVKADGMPSTTDAFIAFLKEQHELKAGN